MGDRESILENRGFGRYLRRIREGRRLSLDSVEEMSTGYPERITKSHLSRIENGQAVPTFPRLFALSQIYGVPVSSLAERFEIEMRGRMVPPGVERLTDEQVIERASTLLLSGQYHEALLLYSAALDRAGVGAPTPPAVELQLGQVNCLVHLARYESAKQECEKLLNEPALTAEQRIVALQLFVVCAFRLSRFTIAKLGYDRLRQDAKGRDVSERRRAEIASIGGGLHAAMGDWKAAAALFEEAIALYETLPRPFEVCRNRINLAGVLVETERYRQARNLLRTALEEAERQGFERQKALALSNLAVIAFREGGTEVAERYCLRSNTIARPRDYVSVVFRNCFYLWKIAREKGDAASVRMNERSLRASIGKVEEFLPEAAEFRSYMSGRAS